MPKAWSLEEQNYLEDNWGRLPTAKLAKRLNKTETAIVMKAKRLGLGAASAPGEYINASQISRLLGVDRHTVLDYWAKKCGLNGRYKIVRSTQKLFMVKFDVLINWLKLNLDKWDSRRVEAYSLGTEDDWLKEKRKADRLMPKNKFLKWTNREDQQAIAYFKVGYTCKQIGAMLDRSGESVSKRLSKLDVWGTGKLKVG